MVSDVLEECEIHIEDPDDMYIVIPDPLCGNVRGIVDSLAEVGIEFLNPDTAWPELVESGLKVALAWKDGGVE